MAEPGEDAPSEEIRAALQGAIGVAHAKQSPTRVYLFISFDLVNSTIYKQRSASWTDKLSRFYSLAVKGIEAKIANAVVWKYAGDEVLFWSSPADDHDICKQVQLAYEALESLDTEISSESRGELRVKGSCWVALAAPEGPATGSAAPNLVYNHSDQAGVPARDFLGPEIDAGFRLGQHTLQRTLALSAELAAFLSKYADGDLRKNVRLVAFRKLKGVWQNRLYPICWYRSDLTTGFDYDDKHENELLAEASQQRHEGEDLRAIVEVVKPGYVDGLMSALKSGSEGPRISPRLEVHCVGVCRSLAGKILIAQRLPTKSVLPGIWEFGCAQLRPGDSFTDAIKRDYKDDFRAEIDFVDLDDPLSTYFFRRGSGLVQGVVLAAIVTNPGDCQPARHQRIDWIDPGEVPEDLPKIAVPDFGRIVAKIASRSVQR